MISNISSYFEHKCPVCGLISPFSDCTTTMIANGRRTSIQEVEAYQALYGSLVEVVDHYKN